VNEFVRSSAGPLRSTWSGARARSLSSAKRPRRWPSLPGLDIVSIARGYGCDATLVAHLDALKQAVAAAWTKKVPTVLEVLDGVDHGRVIAIPISAQIPALV
jgi:thiamine pyrophosphate-dependent acetolactate synthase large subunit-like protein